MHVRLSRAAYLTFEELKAFVAGRRSGTFVAGAYLTFEELKGKRRRRGHSDRRHAIMVYLTFEELKGSCWMNCSFSASVAVSYL